MAQRDLSELTPAEPVKTGLDPRFQVLAGQSVHSADMRQIFPGRKWQRGRESFRHVAGHRPAGHAAPGWLRYPRDDTQDRGLAAAVLALEPDQAARRDLHAYVPDDPWAADAVALRYLFEPHASPPAAAHRADRPAQPV